MSPEESQEKARQLEACLRELEEQRGQLEDFNRSLRAQEQMYLELLAAREATITELTAKAQEQEALIAQLKRMLFGPTSERMTEEQAAERRRDHCRDAQMHQRRGGLLARRPDAEVGPGGDHIAGARLERELGPQRLQAVLGDDFRAVLDPQHRRQRIGVDIGGQTPDTAPWRVVCRVAAGPLLQPRACGG